MQGINNTKRAPSGLGLQNIIDALKNQQLMANNQIPQTKQIQPNMNVHGVDGPYLPQFMRDIIQNQRPATRTYADMNMQYVPYSNMR